MYAVACRVRRLSEMIALKSEMEFLQTNKRVVLLALLPLCLEAPTLYS